MEVLIKTVDFEESANPVFRGFMVSWVRKLVIAEALAGIDAQLRQSVLRAREQEAPQPLPSSDWTRESLTTQEFDRAVPALDVFPRCALLLTVFEGLSIADTALLLNADRALVKRVQARALAELTRNIVGNAGGATQHTGLAALQYAVMNI